MLQILNKIEFENNCWVGLIDSSNFNSSEEERIKAVTDIASITKGKLGFDDKIEVGINPSIFNTTTNQVTPVINDRRLNLYHRLLTESAGKPSTPFEFVPVKYHTETGFHVIAKSSLDRMKYSTVDESNNHILTNLRNDLTYNKDRYFDNIIRLDSENFKVIVGRVPMKVISHLRTHRAFSWLVESSRNKRYLNEVEFWYPSWWDNNTISLTIGDDEWMKARKQVYIDEKKIKPEEATMELSDRRLVYFAMAAWKQDSNAWDNLFTVRGNKTGTMSITGMTVNNIKKLIYE